MYSNNAYKSFKAIFYLNYVAKYYQYMFTKVIET